MIKVDNLNDFIILGNNICNKRHEKGLSQTELADLVNTTRNTIGRIESADVVMGVDKLFAIAKVLDCTLEDLCPEELIKKTYIKENNQMFTLYECLSEPNKNVVFDTFLTLVNRNDTFVS